MRTTDAQNYILNSHPISTTTYACSICSIESYNRKISTLPTMFDVDWPLQILRSRPTASITYAFIVNRYLLKSDITVLVRYVLTTASV